MESRLGKDGSERGMCGRRVGLVLCDLRTGTRFQEWKLEGGLS